MAEQKRSLFGGIWSDFRQLMKAPRDLWIVYGAKLTESVAYFAVVNVLILYLHDDLRFSDEWSGSLYGARYTFVSALVFLSGFIADAMGKRRALIVAASTLIVGRSLLLFSEVRWVPLAGLLIGCWGVATMKPVLVSAVKQHAPLEIRSFAFSIYYVVMNLGAFVAGHLVAGLRIGLLGRVIRPGELFDESPPVAPEAAREELVQDLLPRFPAAEDAEHANAGVRSFARMATGGRDLDYWTAADLDAIREAAAAQLAGQPIPDPPMGLSGYEMIFFVATILSIFSLLIVRMLRVDEVPPAEGEEKAEMSVGAVGVRSLKIARELMKEQTFWAFVLFVSLLVLVRAVFVHAHSTWPTYMLREFGADTPQAVIWSFNPLLIILLTPIVGSLTSRFSAWWVIIVGACITSSSLLFMVVHEPYEAVARAIFSGFLGPDVPYEYAGAYLFVAVLSVGEALWSPRLYEYIAMMAPKGREASYMGLAELPLFAAKIPVGVMSGFLIGTWCAENQPCESEPIWLIVFATTLAGPIIALLFSGFIRAAERARMADHDDRPEEF